MTKLTERILARREQAGLDVASALNIGDPYIDSSNNAPQHELAKETVDTRDLDAHVLPVSAIVVRAQARKSFHRIKELAADIRARGQLQPIVVRETPEKQYILLSGERRLRALRDELQQPTILARLIRCDIDEQSWRLSQLAENLQREDYEPLDIAREFSALKEEFGYSNVTLADKLHVSRAWVWRQLSLLEAPASIQESIENGSLAATEYLNNKSLYLSDLSSSNASDGSTSTATSTHNGISTSPSKKSVSRITNIPLPMKTAMDLVEILCRLTHEHHLSPIELSKKPTKTELLAVFGTRVQEIKQQLQSLQPRQQHEV